MDRISLACYLSICGFEKYVLFTLLLDIVPVCIRYGPDSFFHSIHIPASMMTLGLQWPRQADDDDDDDAVVLPQEHRLAPNDKASNMCSISVSRNPTVSHKYFSRSC